MLVRLGNIFLIVALLAATGAHWALLQSVAWMGMVVSYSENGSFKDALAKTFDGKHPCRLCKVITAAKKSEKKPEFSPLTQRLEFPPVAEQLALVPPAQSQILLLANTPAKSLLYQPPTPPPRGVLA